MPDQYKMTSRYELGGKKVRTTQVIDGQTEWAEFDDRVQDLPKEALAEILDRLGFLGDKGVEATALGESKVGDRVAVGVLVKSKGYRDGWRRCGASFRPSRRGRNRGGSSGGHDPPPRGRSRTKEKRPRPPGS
jgi:hypothetical protein